MRFIVLSIYICCLNGAFVSTLNPDDKDMAQPFSNSHQSEMIRRVQRSDSSDSNEHRNRQDGTGSDGCTYGCTDKCLRSNAHCFLTSKKFTIVTTNDEAPFISQTGNNGPVGFDVDLINFIANIYKIKFRYRYLPFAQLISAVQNDTNTISINLETDTLAREQYVDFAQFFRTGTGFLVQSSYNIPINGLSDLCGKVVGALQGSIQESDVQKQNTQCGTNTIIYKSYPSESDLINAVQNGLVNVALDDEAELVLVVSQSNNQLKIVGNQYNIQTVGILCNKNNRPLCCALVNAINYLIQKGVYESLLQKYSFSYKNNGVCPSRININGTTCLSTCTPSHGFCATKLK